MLPSLKLGLAFFPVIFLMACANEPGAENPSSTAPTKADIKAREEFARNLPKPPER